MSVRNNTVLGLPCGSTGKESVCNVRDLGSIPGLGRPPGEGKGYLLHGLQWLGWYILCILPQLKI